jgi:3'-phosphoadenosine 5'-phosphosulfate sulfotransferase (PAPS reductase)/FAD synthetase
MGVLMIKIVVPISGGKDSQACLKLALESYDKSEVMGLFFDTQFEHPLTYKHISWISIFYDVKVERIKDGRTVPELVLQYKRFPDRNIRFCTDRLKIQPSKKFYKQFAATNGPFEVWYGLRSDESKAREKRYKGLVSDEIYPAHEVFKDYPKYLESMGVLFRLPIIDWAEDEVYKLLDGEENPLYKNGSKRVGCFPCLASSDRSKERDFAFDDFGKEQRIIVSELEKKIGHSIFTSKGGAIRNNENQSDIFAGCSFCAI